VNSIHRIVINIDDGDRQQLELTGPPISVAPDREGSSARFDLWFEHMEGDRPAYELNYHHAYTIYIFGTGHPVPWDAYSRHEYSFLGTVVTPLGLVWHVYRGPNSGESVGI
jgi:hypothetical protein